MSRVSLLIPFSFENDFIPSRLFRSTRLAYLLYFLLFFFLIFSPNSPSISHTPRVS